MVPSATAATAAALKSSPGRARSSPPFTAPGRRLPSANLSAVVRIGLLGSGFVADFYMEGLRDVPGAEVVANYSRSDERANEFGRRHGVSRQYTTMEDLCADEDVDMVNLVRKAGVMHGYAETEVFSPDVMRAREMIESGAIGDVLTVRAREAHSGPHAPHFWDGETAGGGALLDMGCHTVEAARYFFGKENRIKDVFAWGATLVHTDKTKGEDNAVLLLRLEDGRTSLTEASWTAKGGMELRNEIYGTMGRIITDTSSTR